MLSKQLVRNVIDTNGIIKLNRCIFCLEGFVYYCLFMFSWKERGGGALSIFAVSSWLIEAESLLPP